MLQISEKWRWFTIRSPVLRAYPKTYRGLSVSGQVSCSTTEQWDQLESKGGWREMNDQPKRPKTIHYRIHAEVKLLVVVPSTLLGWGERRISAELARFCVGKISHTNCFQ